VGGAAASKGLVLVSGTHGVEGFLGSACQTGWLRGDAFRVPNDTAVILVHALNPYGFAWCRRVTHENVDLNRNFLDYEALDAAAVGPPENSAYRSLEGALNPLDLNDGT